VESYAQTPFHDHSCSTVSWGQITFLGRVILLCPNYLHMDVNDGGDLSPSISSRWLLDNFYCCFYAWLACTANSPSSTKTLAGLLLVLSDLGIAHWHRTMSPVRGPWASVMMFPIRVLCVDSPITSALWIRARHLTEIWIIRRSPVRSRPMCMLRRVSWRIFNHSVITLAKWKRARYLTEIWVVVTSCPTVTYCWWKETSLPHH